MLPLHATHSHTHRQDSSESNSSRRPDADRARLLKLFAVIQGSAHRQSAFKLTTWRVYIHLMTGCYVQPILLGESDKVVTIADCPTEIGFQLGIGRAHVSRAIDELIEKGYAKSRSGRLWPTRWRFDQLASLVPQPTQDERADFARDVAPTVRFSHAELPSTVAISHAESASPIGETGAHARSRSLINSEKTGAEIKTQECVCNPESSLERTQDTHTHTDGCLDAVPFPWTDEDAAAIDRFADEQLLNIRVATECRRLIRGLYPPGWVVKAMKRAKTKNINSFSYIRQILVQWESAGEPNPGDEDHYDGAMQPIKARRLPDLAPAAAPMIAGRFPPSRADRERQDDQRRKEQIEAGICPWTGKPFSEVYGDE